MSGLLQYQSDRKKAAALHYRRSHKEQLVAYAKERYEKNKERFRLKWKKYYQKNKQNLGQEMRWTKFLIAGILKYRTCNHCQREFESTNTTKIFCSDRCRQIVRRRLKLKMRPIHSQCVCAHCNKEFTCITGNQKFCSRDCASFAAKLAPPQLRMRKKIRSCAVCERRFIGPRRKFCSDECFHEWKRDWKKNYAKNYYNKNRGHIKLKNFLWAAANKEKTLMMRKKQRKKYREAYAILRLLVDRQNCTKLGISKRMRSTSKPAAILNQLIGKENANALFAHGA